MTIGKEKGEISSGWNLGNGKCWALYHKTTIIMLSDKRFCGCNVSGTWRTNENEKYKELVSHN